MKDPTRPILSVLIVVGMFAMIYILITGEIRTTDANMLVMIGAAISSVIGMAKDVVAFQFAASREGVEQGKTIATIAKANMGNGNGNGSYAAGTGNGQNPSPTPGQQE